MNAQPQRTLKLPILNDDDLRALIDRRHSVAFHIMLYVRKRAMLKGRLEIEIPTWEIERDLKLDRRAVQRAKAYLREQGFSIEQPVARHRGRHGQAGNLSCVFSVDRRPLRALHLVEKPVSQENHGGAVSEAVATREEKQHLLGEPKVQVPPVDVGRAPARDGPLPAGAVASSSDREPAPHRAVGVSVVGPVPSSGLSGLPRVVEVEPELTQLREWVEGSGKAALTGQRAIELLDRAEAHVVREGGDWWRAKLARRLLELELGAGQLELGAGDDGSLDRGSSDAGQQTDVVDSDESRSMAEKGEQ